MPQTDNSEKIPLRCPVSGKCGGCDSLHIPYGEQLAEKQRRVEALLGTMCPVQPIAGMESPYRYRNKVEAVFGVSSAGKTVFGKYRRGSHSIIGVPDCLLEDEKADRIIADIADMTRRFSLPPFDEKKERGMLRHVLVRRAFATGEIMVVPVLNVPAFKAQKPFVAELCRRHPEIGTIVLNCNDRRTSMVLGKREKVIFGKGYIEDILCGCRFRISARSFYQVNPIQTEKLYRCAIEYAGLTGRETVLDAYCGTGTIGIAASSGAKEVLGVELNEDAVKDAVGNARRNGAVNCRFVCGDAGRFMSAAAAEGRRADVVFTDPPRSGCDEKFLKALMRMKPERIVYVSCCPETLARDLGILRRGGYSAVQAQPVDMFPHTEHIETVVQIDRVQK